MRDAAADHGGEMGVEKAQAGASAGDPNGCLRDATTGERGAHAGLRGVAGHRTGADAPARALSALADSVLERSMLVDRDGHVQWAGPAFGPLDSDAPSSAGAPPTVTSLLSRLGETLDEKALAAVCAGATGQVLTFSKSGEKPVGYCVVQRSLPDTEHRALALFDVTDTVRHLAAVEKSRAAFEARLNNDVETGLPNERRLLQVLIEALRDDCDEPRSVGLILLEVLDFGQIVDLYGADTGAEVIQEVVFALSDALPEGTFFARTRGHEFAVVFDGETSNQGLITAAEAMAQAGCFDVETALGSCRVSTVLAVAVMKGGEGSPDQLLNNARIAMGFRDLPRRAGQVRLYEPEMRAALEARSRTYNELHAALSRDEIEPFFQPQVRLSDRQVVGFEVLVRWRHPEQGLVPPGLFLEIAEETGLLPQIDDIVMQKAMACLASWERMGLNGGRISLNCTGEALRDPGYISRLRREMARHDLSSEQIAIEILENVLFGDEEDAARQTLKLLQQDGFYLEIDDFGTGQASISHLITLNANAVKLDRSLVRNIETDRANRMVVEATLALSRNLGLATLAEGTETEGQMAMLHSLGCDYAQGFGIARPMPYEETTAWIRRRMNMPETDA
ncbi:MAG: phosphodiesterase [Pseudomonadota bacterium]